MLKINNLHKSYKMGDSSLHVLKGIDLLVDKGEMVAIMGSSGSGKSTLLNIIGILDELDSGEYTLDGIEIKDLNEKKAAQYRNKFLGFVFQSFNLINFKNALENVALPLYYQGLKRRERQEKAMFHLNKVGLKDWSTHLPNELSGGQKQRVALARCYYRDADILLFDEATSALDETTEKLILKNILSFDKSKTIVFATHNKNLSKMFGKTFLVKGGEILLVERDIISDSK